MMLKSQRSFFQLPDDVHYLNGAYMSPLMNAVEEAGIRGMQLKRNPGNITPDDFFQDAENVCARFAQLIHAKPHQIAIIPSVSYGLMSAINNLPVDGGQHILMVSDEFPSDHYAVAQWCRQHGKHIKTISAPNRTDKRGEKWNSLILENIDDDTIAVVLSSIHWTDGTIFDLKSIGQQCRASDALFLVDGTQSVGAMPIDVVDYKIDALICAAYKWLLGPYSIGLAFYGEIFDQGRPLEESWANRTNARNFSALTQYTDEYNPGAGRYQVGEYSNFILLPMLKLSLDQILDWKVENIRDYSSSLSTPLATYLRENGCWVEASGGHASHLLGALMPANVDLEDLVNALRQQKVYVSRRGNTIRISIHVYNTEVDVQVFKEVLRQEGVSG